MKLVKAVLAVSVLLAFFVGCSKESVNPVASIANQESVAQLGFAIDPKGIMAKKAALAKTTADSTDFIPAYFIITIQNLRADTIVTSRPDTVIKSYRFEKLSSHVIEGAVLNSKKAVLNWGMKTFAVPDSDTCSVSITCASYATELHLKVPLKGTPAKSVAYAAKIVSTAHTGQNMPIADSNKVTFIPNTLDTVSLLGFLFPRYGWTIQVTIYCNDGTSDYVYQGSADISMLNPSAPYSITIALTKYGTGGSSAKLLFTISPNGRVDATVIFN